MTGYLLDTNVISMFAPTTQQASSAFVAWVEQADRDGELFLSAVTVHEPASGSTSTNGCPAPLSSRQSK